MIDLDTNVLVRCIVRDDELHGASGTRLIEYESAWAALRSYASDAADFADYLIGMIHVRQGCGTRYTFDKRAERSAQHTLLE